MNWPLVSRTAYSAVCNERDYLRTQVERLTDAITRIERASAGLPEIAPQKKEAVRWPESLRSLVSGFNTEHSRARYRARVYRELQEGRDVEAIELDIRRELGIEPEVSE